MIYIIEFRTLSEQQTAVRRASLAANELPGWLADTYSRAGQYLAHTGVSIVGPPFARYQVHDGTMDVEAGFPVGQIISGNGDIVASALPGGPVAVTTHYGPYDTVELAYKAVLTWLQEQAHEAAGGHWELYLTDPETEPDPARWRTDLVMPCRPLRI